MSNKYETYDIETGPSLAGVTLQMTHNVLWIDNKDNVFGSVTINELLYAMTKTGAITLGEYNKISNRRTKKNMTIPSILVKKGGK